VSLLGEKHYAEIPDWVSKFDVVIIPFKRTPLTESTNPVKAYEILAAGKPIVSVPIPEMRALSRFVRLASDAKEFEKEISDALTDNEPKQIEARRAFAKENTWEKRYEALAPAVRNVFAKASIVIVTFNNIELNRLCLESIYARTEWPNFEVIVVDNNSTDGTREYLKEAEENFPNLRVVLNDSNLGFAAANNIGLQQATGDYLVLLNNDTIVTRGWLSTLIRHLQADVSIGLIGPVTNNIGNEAKVDVGYSDPEDMPAWAASFVREHDGQVFSIPMLAMFCLAMRRDVFEKVGWLDEQFGIGLFEDDDYTHRVKTNGFRIVCAADAFVHHFGQAAFKKLVANGEYQELFDENRRRYERKWNIEWVPHQYAQTNN
ncbi:MAG TPA: glycosyltransferase, partial [Nitrososphaera sp.]|nr:glycosyltransferase [Nitrososphaera sp.]